MRVALIVAAACFAVVAGANDGSSILSAGLRVPGLRPVASVVILLVTLVVGPSVLFGTGVATTLARRLVPFAGTHTDAVVLVAALSAMVVVLGLARAGLPTSLTLGLIGAITGAGLGAGLPVSGGILAEILLVGLVAPIAAGILAFAASRVAVRALHGPRMTRRLRRLHVVAYSLQCLAYSANGGQKMLAVFAVAAGAAGAAGATGATGPVVGRWWLYPVVAALFGVGVGVGLRRVSTSLGKELLAVHLRHAVVAETCSFALVMATGVTGVPLTMSQSVAGALVGAGASEARTRVRWPAAARLAGAWVVTLPASIALAAVASMAAVRL